MKEKSSNIDFLGIGVQKAASTWLWSILKQHPKIWVPPRKELHYFDRDISYPSPSFLHTPNLQERLSGMEEHNKLFRLRLNELSLEKFYKTQNDILWYHKYFFGTYNDEWYQSLFEEGKDKVKGEVTPAYSILNKDDIFRIKNLFPKIKIILILRNPIDRALSHIKHSRRVENLDVSNAEELKAFINSPAQEMRGNYPSILENWLSFFSRKQLFIGFYDEIELEPERFVKKVFDFLEVDYHPMEYAKLKQKKNASLDIDISHETKSYLNNKYFHDIKNLANIFDSYPRTWLEKLEAIRTY